MVADAVEGEPGGVAEEPAVVEAVHTVVVAEECAAVAAHVPMSAIVAVGVRTLEAVVGPILLEAVGPILAVAAVALVLEAAADLM